MMISVKQITGCKVQTKGGQNLGRVTDVILNDASFELEQIEVDIGLIKSIMGNKLLIHKRQIIEVRESVIIVEDGTVKQGKLSPAMDVDV